MVQRLTLPTSLRTVIPQANRRGIIPSALQRVIETSVAVLSRIFPPTFIVIDTDALFLLFLFAPVQGFLSVVVDAATPA